MKKVIAISGVLLSLLITPQVFASSCKEISEVKREYTQFNNQGDIEIVPYDMFINSGSYRGTAFQETYSLKKSNGSSVNFWIRNNGAYPVTIRINGNERTINSGKEGHVSHSVGFFSSKYYFTANSPYGGDININFRIAQRN